MILKQSLQTVLFYTALGMGFEFSNKYFSNHPISQTLRVIDICAEPLMGYYEAVMSE